MRIVEQTSAVNYRVVPVSGKRLPYIVHVERLKRFVLRELTDESNSIINDQVVIHNPEGTSSDDILETLNPLFDQNGQLNNTVTVGERHLSPPPNQPSPLPNVTLVDDLIEETLAPLRRSNRDRAAPEPFGY